MKWHWKVCSALLITVSVLSNAQIAEKTVLVTSNQQSVTTVNANGAATNIGGVAVGTAGSTSTTYNHTDVLEAVRRFKEQCPGVNFVITPDTLHDLTVYVDSEKVNGGIFIGQLSLFQLSVLDKTGNPIYISKKNYLRREIKPICHVLEAPTK